MAIGTGRKGCAVNRAATGRERYKRLFDLCAAGLGLVLLFLSAVDERGGQGFLRVDVAVSYANPAWARADLNWTADWDLDRIWADAWR